MSTAVEVLEFSRDLVKAGWTRGVWAEDISEQSVNPEDTRACAFCLAGALKRAHHVLKPSVADFHAARSAAYDEIPRKGSAGHTGSNFVYDYLFTQFNDAQQSEEPIVDLFDRAIASLKEPA